MSISFVNKKKFFLFRSILEQKEKKIVCKQTKRKNLDSNKVFHRRRRRRCCCCYLLLKQTEVDSIKENVDVVEHRPK